jgi:hypothetical protein
MRDYWLTKAEWAKELDFDLVKELYEWAQDNGIKILSEEVYFMLCMDEFRVVYSRASERLQCYYVGYGHDTVERSLFDFDNLDEILEWIEHSKGMELKYTKLIHKVQSELMGYKARDYEKKWNERLREYLNGK